MLVLPLLLQLLGLATPAALLGGAGALAAALYVTQNASEKQQRSRSAQRRALPDLLR